MKQMKKWFSKNLIRIYAFLAFTYLFIPVLYTFVFSFNDSRKTNLIWKGFTLDKWKNPCGAPDVCNALGNSFIIGLTATTISTVLGTLIAFALGRYKFKGRSTTNLLIFLPMATPEIVLGASLLTMFVNLGVNTSMVTAIIAHVMFCISFVVVTVKARVASLDANEWQTFRRVTLPLVAPGIAAAALLAFSLSFDDFIITNFTAGTVNTFPRFVYVSAGRGIPAQANVIGSAMFFLALFIVVTAQIASSRRKAKI
jgi:spermidine/putrescine transport system permease protein